MEPGDRIRDRRRRPAGRPSWAVGAGALEVQPPQQTLGVDSSVFVTLGGVDQYVEVRGASPELPVLLYLRGGPCMPATPFLRFYQAELARRYPDDYLACVGVGQVVDLREGERLSRAELVDL